MQIFAEKQFENPIKIIQAFDKKSFLEAFSQIENLRKRSETYLLGYIRYEAKDIFLGKHVKSEYPLLYFEVFEESGTSEFCSQNSPDKAILNPQPQIDYKTYSKAIEQIKEEISDGNTYQVNYTYDYKVEIKGDTDLAGLDGLKLYNHILQNQKTPYNAYIKNDYEEILSFSPELFFELKGDKIKTKPMKGTIKRGKNDREDKENIEFLKNDIKNRAENVMIVDLLRNDLGKIAKTGTVKVDKLFEVETHNTLHQMTSEVSAELEKDTTLLEIFEALFPCGSVTGAPKINTMKIIDELEVGSRDVYCGAIGLISPEKTVFSVPIRILQKPLSQKYYTCRVGGAIVWDSTAEDEWEETLTKIKFLGKFLGKSLEPNFQLIETILVESGKTTYGKEHFDRMKKSANELGFKFNSGILNIKPEKDGILRILLSKDGVFETQYLPLEPIKTNKITVSKTPIQSSEKLLYHKTNYRPWYDEAIGKIKENEIFDEIFFNEKGELTEGARTNIVLQIDGALFTPPLKCGLLKGVLRRKMINDGKIKEKILYLSDLKTAEKIFCINSVRGIVEVTLDKNFVINKKIEMGEKNDID